MPPREEVAREDGEDDARESNDENAALKRAERRELAIAGAERGEEADGLTAGCVQRGEDGLIGLPAQGETNVLGRLRQGRARQASP